MLASVHLGLPTTSAGSAAARRRCRAWHFGLVKVIHCRGLCCAHCARHARVTRTYRQFLLCERGCTLTSVYVEDCELQCVCVNVWIVDCCPAPPYVRCYLYVPVHDQDKRNVLANKARESEGEKEHSAFLSLCGAQAETSLSGVSGCRCR